MPAATMLDLPESLRDAGLRVWVAPDWRTNGHSIDLIDPFGGLWHHTAGYGLRAVYGLPDARPDVPQPRCNLWTPRPGWVAPDGKRADIAVCSAGRGWHAGTGRRQAYDDLRAGRFTARTADAAARFGRDSDDVDAGWTSAHTIGNEVEWLSGDVPDEQLDVIATTSAVCVDLFDWPGPGCWAHHRQMTYRKPDMAYRGDLWTATAQALDTIRNGGAAMPDPEDLWDYPIRNPDSGSRLTAGQRLLGTQAGVDQLGRRVDQLTAQVGALRADVEQIPAPAVYAKVAGRPEIYQVRDGQARHVTAEEWAFIGAPTSLVKQLDPTNDAALLGQLGIAAAATASTPAAGR